MNNQTIYYNSPTLQESKIIYANPVSYKGSTSVTFVLTGINEEITDVLFLEVSWGDGSVKEFYQKDLAFDYKEQSIFNEILYGKIGGSVAVTYTHDFYNTLETYNAAVSSQFLLTFSSGVTLHIIQPISIYRSSFYDEIVDLNILSTQITPTTANYTFFNFEGSGNRQLYVGVLSSDSEYGAPKNETN